LPAEDRIVMPLPVPAGFVPFLVTNRGSRVHNSEIRGPSVSQRFAIDVQPDETRLMQARLAPDNDTVICPVDAHTLLGMQTHLMVY
jgi:hypothetical protein